jgi:hypothetical protein
LAAATLAGAGPAAGSMSAAANFAGFDTLLCAYLDYRAMKEEEILAFLGRAQNLPASARRLAFWPRLCVMGRLVHTGLCS